MGFLANVMGLLFPPKCIFCRRVLPPGKKEGSCPACAASLPVRDPPRTGTWFRCCHSPLRYEGTVREALIRFKFQDQSGYATEFGRIMADCIRENLSGQYDLISWVPVSQERLRQRGYDQAMLLGMAAALELGDVAVETLVKGKHTPAQSSLESARDRQQNVRGAYRAADPELVRDKRILLVDDIVTTGATLDEASRTLLEAGAERVVCAAVAHTVDEHKEEETL